MGGWMVSSRQPPTLLFAPSGEEACESLPSISALLYSPVPHAIIAPLKSAATPLLLFPSGVCRATCWR